MASHPTGPYSLVLAAFNRAFRAQSGLLTALLPNFHACDEYVSTRVVLPRLFASPTYIITSKAYSAGPAAVHLRPRSSYFVPMAAKSSDAQAKENRLAKPESKKILFHDEGKGSLPEQRLRLKVMSLTPNSTVERRTAKPVQSNQLVDPCDPGIDNMILHNIAVVLARADDAVLHFILSGLEEINAAEHTDGKAVAQKVSELSLGLK